MLNIFSVTIEKTSPLFCLVKRPYWSLTLILEFLIYHSPSHQVKKFSVYALIATKLSEKEETWKFC